MHEDGNGMYEELIERGYTSKDIIRIDIYLRNPGFKSVEIDTIDYVAVHLKSGESININSHLDIPFPMNLDADNNKRLREVNIQNYIDKEFKFKGSSLIE